MAHKTLVKIYNEASSSWIRLPMPSDYKGTVSTLVDTGRNAKGVMIGSVILSGIGKVEMSWNYLDYKVWATILSLFEPNTNSLYSNKTGNFINYVRFFDQVSGTWVTRKMYVNDRSSSAISLDRLNQFRGWESPSIHLIDTGEDVTGTEPTDNYSPTFSNNYAINKDGTLTKVYGIDLGSVSTYITGTWKFKGKIAITINTTISGTFTSNSNVYLGMKFNSSGVFYVGGGGVETQIANSSGDVSPNYREFNYPNWVQISYDMLEWLITNCEKVGDYL